ncbi:hypothetical protein R6Q59_027958 [Mikania micrantha]
MLAVGPVDEGRLMVAFTIYFDDKPRLMFVSTLLSTIKSVSIALLVVWFVWRLLVGYMECSEGTSTLGWVGLGSGLVMSFGTVNWLGNMGTPFDGWGLGWFIPVAVHGFFEYLCGPPCNLIVPTVDSRDGDRGFALLGLYFGLLIYIFFQAYALH